MNSEKSNDVMTQPAQARTGTSLLAPCYVAVLSSPDGTAWARRHPGEPLSAALGIALLRGELALVSIVPVVDLVQDLAAKSATQVEP